MGYTSLACRSSNTATHKWRPRTSIRDNAVVWFFYQGKRVNFSFAYGSYYNNDGLQQHRGKRFWFNGGNLRNILEWRGPYNFRQFFIFPLNTTGADLVTFLFEPSVPFEIWVLSPVHGGEGEIRTLGTFRYTVFPGLPVKPLLHLSAMNGIVRQRRICLWHDDLLIKFCVHLNFKANREHDCQFPPEADPPPVENHCLLARFARALARRADKTPAPFLG